MNQLNPEKPSGLMVATRSSLYLWRQSRTAFNKKLGFSPISKGKGCLAIATLNPTFTFLGRDFAVLNMAKSLPKKVKVGFRVVMAKYLNSPIL